MGTNEKILQKVQAGLESSRGVNVAATRKVYAQLTSKYARALQKYADSSGTYHARRRPSYARAKPSHTAVDIATFEDLPWWLQMALKGGVTGVGDAGAPQAYLYTFNPTITADDLKSATFEFNESGNPYESAQMMATKLTMRMDSDNDNEPCWMIDLDLMARDWETTTFTPALVDRSTEPILARGTKLFIDNAAGTIGTTQVNGALISASAVIQNNLVFKAFAEDTVYVAVGRVGRKEQTIDLQLTFEFDNDTEFANYRSISTPQQRLIRLQSDGSQIHATPNTPKQMNLDVYGFYDSWDMGDRDGNLTATMNLAGFYDIAAGKTFQVSVQNALATLP